MIKSRAGIELKLGDIVSSSYKNGWWYGIIEQPDFYAGTVTAIRILGGNDYFWDFKLNSKEYKHINISQDNDIDILENFIINKKALDKQYLEIYELKILASRPEGIMVNDNIKNSITD